MLASHIHAPHDFIVLKFVAPVHGSLEQFDGACVSQALEGRLGDVLQPADRLWVNPARSSLLIANREPVYGPGYVTYYPHRPERRNDKNC